MFLLFTHSSMSPKSSLKLTRKASSFALVMPHRSSSRGCVMRVDPPSPAVGSGKINCSIVFQADSRGWKIAVNLDFSARRSSSILPRMLSMSSSSVLSWISLILSASSSRVRSGNGFVKRNVMAPRCSCQAGKLFRITPSTSRIPSPLPVALKRNWMSIKKTKRRLEQRSASRLVRIAVATSIVGDLVSWNPGQSTMKIDGFGSCQPKMLEVTELDRPLTAHACRASRSDVTTYSRPFHLNELCAIKCRSVDLPTPVTPMSITTSCPSACRKVGSATRTA
mmetsp:Transcript_68337/g.135050  ORF Transcript_68337/g.135050 Transcript_68337/m.135050 type:complete len:280 (-) Transcript_68337:680-1519(-)